MIKSLFISLKKISIVGEVDKYPLEQRVLNGISLIGGIATILSGFLIDKLILPAPLYYTLLFVGVLISSAFYLSRFQNRFLTALLVFTASLTTLLFVDWYLNGGVEGILLTSFIVHLVVFIQCFPRKYYSQLIIGEILIISCFIFLEFNFSHIRISDVVPKELRIVHWVMMSFFTTSILILFKNQYKKWEERLLEKEKALANALEKEQVQNKVKEEFISMISHQFRTPLTVIRSSTELLELSASAVKSEFEEKRSRKQFSNVYSAIDSLTNMMEGVIFYNRIKNKEIEFFPTKINAVSFISSTIKNYPLKNALSLENFKVEGTPCEVSIDPNLMEVCISNLLSNALKFSEPLPVIAITIIFKEDNLNIIISDNGIGIPQNESSRIFDPFFRASNAKNIKGTGIGLTITQLLIELHKGKITIESKENEGTKVVVSLPTTDLPNLNFTTLTQSSNEKN
ncbi:sensor histidine kinase [Sediminitomix flava]|uniref:histidine kinase n=1 Tax=Sediminitomix flava TaxID=379075 RepID=A0A315ZE57_SEDFL|nr:HAMP domain-containing sensor histidine kinase [Sediminitomix flava]PWJ43024.1 signal transduction histidine kinase [Sediminitomix flava]